MPTRRDLARGAAALALAAGLAVVPYALSRGRAAASSEGNAKGKPRYHCPMHPTYTSDRPGDCPICNMRLVPIPEAAAPAPSPVEGHATVPVPADARRRIGVRMGTVERRPVARTIRAAGRVEWDERTLSTVSLKFSGWAEELHVKAVGDRVRKGDPLLSIYAPDLLEAQRNLLLARSALEAPPGGDGEARVFAEQTRKSARERLLLWDLTEAQVRAIEEGKEPRRVVEIVSKADGVVIRRDATRGAYLEAGRPLYEIADPAAVWIIADVFEEDAADLRAGQEAGLEFAAFPGETRRGTLAYIYPSLNESSRTIRARIEAPNGDGRLKPGMWGSVSVRVDLGAQLVVDDGAILETGMAPIVFVDAGGDRLEPREVAVGARLEGRAVILRGLKEGERVVTSGTFLVDSESRLKAALHAAPGGTAPPPHEGSHAH